MTPDDPIKIKLAEYSALRAEITTFLALQGQFMSYSIALTGVISALGLSSSYANALKEAALPAFLMSPFLILGILYADVRLRILRVADYIENKLRDSLLDGSPESASCLGWESFIRQSGDMTRFLSITEWLRYLVFLLPVLVLLILLILNWSTTQQPRLCGFILAGDATLLVFFVRVLWKLETYEKTICKKTG